MEKYHNVIIKVDKNENNGRYGRWPPSTEFEINCVLLESLFQGRKIDDRWHWLTWRTRSVGTVCHTKLQNNFI